MDIGTDPPPVPAGFFQLPGRSPEGTGQAWFILSKDALLGHFRTTGNQHKAKEGYLVPHTLNSPTGIWFDLKRDELKDGFCYCGKPESRFLGDVTLEVPILPGKVFAVMISPTRAKHGQYKVLKWTWIEEDSARAGFPVDHTDRFGRRLWPRD